MSFQRSHDHSSLRALSLGALFLAFASCQSPVPPIEAEQSISDAVAVPDAISFRVEGGSVDVEIGERDALPLDAALELALRASPQLQAALARVRIALADAEQSRLLSNPVLDVIFRFPEGGGESAIEAGVSANIASLLRRPGMSRAADDRLRESLAEAVAQSLDVVAEVRERYAAVQSLDQLMPLLEKRRELLARLLTLARARLEFGEGSRLDVTTLEARAVELEIEIAERDAERNDERMALARLLGAPSHAATWQLDAPRALPELVADERAWIASGLEHRPEVQARRWQLLALGEEAENAGSSLLDGATIGIDAQRDPDWSVGPSASLPLPIFDLGSARRARASAAVIEARHNLIAAQRQVVEEVRRTFASFQAAKTNLARVRGELIPRELQRREQVEAIYLAGQADLTAVLLAEEDLQAAQTRLVELERRSTLSLVRLERAVGGPSAARQVGRSDAARSDGVEQ